MLCHMCRLAGQSEDLVNAASPSSGAFGFSSRGFPTSGEADEEGRSEILGSFFLGEVLQFVAVVRKP